MPRDAISLKRIQSHTESLAQILRPGGLQVPKFQRDYSWKLPQWEELWSDVIDSTEKPGKPDEHYMGYIVLREAEDASGCFDIIDGQQRLTTLSILLLAAISLVDNKEQEEILSERYIGEKDPITFEVDGKLTLNDNNKEIYEQLSSGKRSQMGKQEKKMSNRLLIKAFDYFQEKINDRYKGDVDATVQFALDVASGMHLTRIGLLRDMNIYKIFQTLNATGKQLSINDLLKNYLFLAIEKKGGLTKREAAELHRKWSDVEKIVKDKNLAKFISVEWNRRHKFCRAKELFIEINRCVQQPKDIREYLGILRGSGELYKELLDGSASQLWNSQHRNISKELKECLECLNRLKIKSPHGLLLSALEKIKSPATLNKLLRVIRIISMRYNGICQKQANRQEKLYSEMANDAFRGSFAFDAKTKRKLQELYPADSEFYSEFAKVEIDKSNIDKAKYILRAIELKLNPNSILSKADIPGMSGIEIEHILPQSPVAQWRKIFPEYENYVNRLGNLAIVPKKLNKEASNKPFKDKKKIFSFNKKGERIQPTKLTKYVCTEYSVWDANAIDKFQKFLAKQALEIWSIDWERL